MDQVFTHDVFFSYCTKDRPAILDLAGRLRADGFRVWLDCWEIFPGDFISFKIEKGLEESRTLVLGMSESAFSSEWVVLERHIAMFRDPTNSQRRFIPLRLDNSEIKSSLRPFAYVDWRKKSKDEYRRLVAACRRSDASNESDRKTLPN